MKDALGHGSETRGGTHASKVDQIGRPVLSPQVVHGILSTPPGQGFTMRLKDGSTPSQGYQVAIPGHALPAPIGSAQTGMSPEILRSSHRKTSAIAMLRSGPARAETKFRFGITVRRPRS